jgi:hypothetical protein
MKERLVPVGSISPADCTTLSWPNSSKDQHSVDKALANLTAAEVGLGQDPKVELGGRQRAYTSLPDLETLQI